MTLSVTVDHSELHFVNLFPFRRITQLFLAIHYQYG